MSLRILLQNDRVRLTVRLARIERHVLLSDQQCNQLQISRERCICSVPVNRMGVLYDNVESSAKMKIFFLIQSVGEVVYVYEEQDWAQNTALEHSRLHC